MIQSIISIEIDNIHVDEEYYTFNYKIFVDGKLKYKGEINDDYQNGNTPKEQKKDLENGEAVNLAILHCF